MQPRGKIKIGVNGRFLAKPFTGIGRYTINLFSEIAQRHDEIELVIVSAEEIPQWVRDKFPKQTKIVVLPERPFLNRLNKGLAKCVWEKHQLSKFFRKEKIELLHLPYPAIFKIGKKVKTVMTVHDNFPWAMADYRDRNKLSSLYNSWTLKAAKKVDMIFSVSNWGSEEISKMEGIKNSKTYLIPNACEFQEPLKNANVLKRFELRASSYIVYMGGYDKRKNVQRLINIFCRYIAPATDYKLVLGGAEVLKNNLFGNLKIDKYQDRIIKTGFIENDDLRALYSDAKAFVSLTTAEGFNLPLLEALSSQCVALVSDLQVHREVAGDAAGFLDLDLEDTEIGKRIVTLLENKKEYNQLKGKAENYYKNGNGTKYSWGKSADLAAQVYYRLLK